MNFFRQAAEAFSPPEDRLILALKDKSKKNILQNDKADVNCRDKDQRTPLHLAAWNGYWDLIEVFIENGASIDVKESSGRTPLHYACRYGYEKTVRTLLQLGADTGVKDTNGKEPGDEYEPFVREEAKKRISDTLKRSKDPAEKLCAACRKGDLEEVKALVKTTGLESTVRNWIGDTPLQCAASAGQEQVLDFLLKNGASAEGHDGNLAFGLAIAGSHNGIVVKLMQANPNLRPLPSVKITGNGGDSQCCTGGLLGFIARLGGGGGNQPRPQTPQKRQSGVPQLRTGGAATMGRRSISPLSVSSPGHRGTQSIGDAGHTRKSSWLWSGSENGTPTKGPGQNSKFSTPGGSRRQSLGGVTPRKSPRDTPGGSQPNPGSARSFHRSTQSENIGASSRITPTRNAFISRLDNKSQKISTPQKA